MMQTADISRYAVQNLHQKQRSTAQVKWSERCFSEIVVVALPRRGTVNGMIYCRSTTIADFTGCAIGCPDSSSFPKMR